MKKIGNILIVVATVLTIVLYLASKSSLDVLTFSPWLSISQLISLIGTVWLCFSFMLSSRSRWLEEIWGGLDKVTKAHHLMGMLAFLMLINHPLFLAVGVLPNYGLASRYIYLSTNQTYNYGVIALYIMILVLVLTMLVRLPYDLWLKTHDFIGVTLLFASLHIFYIPSDVSRSLPLRAWIFLMLALAIFSYVYKAFLYRWFGPRYKYIVESVIKKGEITEISLRAVGEKLKFRPGQFGFVSFKTIDLSEAHPYSFSSAPSDDLLRFSVKVFGDYTVRLKNLQLGTEAIIWGPYGRMYEKFYGEKAVVAIAGGIGITPFLSLIHEETKIGKPRKIWLFYCTKTMAEAEYLEEIKQLDLPNLSLVLYCSDQKPRLTTEEIAKVVGEIGDKVYYVCGPKPMMDSLEGQLTKNGVRRSNIIIEDFAFKE